MRKRDENVIDIQKNTQLWDYGEYFEMRVRHSL